MIMGMFFGSYKTMQEDYEKPKCPNCNQELDCGKCYNCGYDEHEELESK